MSVIAHFWRLFIRAYFVAFQRIKAVIIEFYICFD